MENIGILVVSIGNQEFRINEGVEIETSYV